MNRFQSKVLIGSGASGVVYRVYDSLTGQTIAGKQIVREDELPKSELTLGRRISHPNVLPIRDLIKDEDGSLYLTMEYIDGGNLRKVMQETGAMPFETFLHYSRQILAAISAAHAKNIIHRDLKPENIL